MHAHPKSDQEQSAEDRVRDAERQTREALDALIEASERLKRLLPELQRATSIVAAQRTAASIMRAASSTVPSADFALAPSGPAADAQRPTRKRVGSGVVMKELKGIAKEARTAGLARGELRTTAEGRGVKPSSFRMAFAKLIEAGELVERDGRIFSAETLVEAGGEKKSEEPMAPAPSDTSNRSDDGETNAAA